MREMLVCLLMLLGAMPANAAPVKLATYRITFSSGGFCSATAISEHVLITAEHCLIGSLATVGNQPAMMIGLPVLDGQDHALLRVSIPLAAWVKVGPLPKQGDWIFFYGNPEGEGDWLRSGLMIGTRNKGAALIFQIPTWPGDSGAGMFNRHGQLVAIVKGIPGYLRRDNNAVAYFDGTSAALPLAFTRNQWAAALK